MDRTNFETDQIAFRHDKEMRTELLEREDSHPFMNIKEKFGAPPRTVRTENEFKRRNAMMRLADRGRREGVIIRALSLPFTRNLFPRSRGRA